MMTPEEFKDKMIECFSKPDEVGYNTEDKHREADGLMAGLLREFGYGEGIKVFYTAKRWYS
jgi:hypothetical protein